MVIYFIYVCFFFFNVFLIKMSACVCLIKKQSSQGLKLFVENICNIDHLAGPFKCILSYLISYSKYKKCL